MGFEFSDDTNWIYMWCSSCWEYRKFVFAKSIDFDLNISISGNCATCNKIEQLDIKAAKDYYNALNKDNN